MAPRDVELAFDVVVQPDVLVLLNDGLDDFLIMLFRSYPDEMITITKDQAKALRNPPLTVFEVLNSLSLHAPKFANTLKSALSQ